ncbi:MAG: YicC family protein [Desulfuromonadia bacterium]
MTVRSMTGYGKGEVQSPLGTVTVEIRSVNHRYAELSVKLPRQLLPFEPEVRRVISERLKRGKIDLSVQFEPAASELGKPTVDLALAKGYLDALRTLGQALGIVEHISLDMIARQKDVIAFTTGTLDYDLLRTPLLDALQVALEAIEGMRVREGGELARDILSRVDRLQLLAEEVARRAPEVPRRAMERMRERVRQLLEGGDVEEQRLLQEIALFADRCDITEELTRFSSHIGQFCDSFSAGEPIGRKLDFLVQELNREVNTIGSKANDREITARVVEMKGELEKIREQIQNIE